MKYALIAICLTGCTELTPQQRAMIWGPPIQYQPIAYNPYSVIMPLHENPVPRSTSCQSYMIGTTMQTNCN